MKIVTLITIWCLHLFAEVKKMHYCKMCGTDLTWIAYGVRGGKIYCENCLRHM